MRTVSRQVGDLLNPLSEFYAALSLQLPEVQPLPGDALPALPRRLLVHEGDMTPTLEAHHGVTLHLRQLHRRTAGESLLRMVVLLRDDDDEPVEFGAIRIDLSLLPEAARALVVEGRRPLGAILAEHAITHRSRPRGFFSLASDATIGDALGLAQPTTLFGRANVLWNHTGKPLAEVVEILPPPAPRNEA
jgi:chorismate-pyruvate lyase